MINHPAIGNRTKELYPQFGFIVEQWYDSRTDKRFSIILMRPLYNCRSRRSGKVYSKNTEIEETTKKYHEALENMWN